jgi:MFS transporter, PHS family, inorganic phosphate transporter
LVAIALRFTIPETPRYLIDVKEDLPAAAQATRRVYPEKKNTPSRQNSDKKSDGGSEPLLSSADKEGGVVQSSSVGIDNTTLTQRRTVHSSNGELANGSYELPENPTMHRTRNLILNPDQTDPGDDITRAPRFEEAVSNTNELKVINEREQDSTSVRSGRKLTDETPKSTAFWYDWRTTYKKGKGFRRILAGTSLCWFIMDICFYGLGLDTPRTLAKIFGAQPSDATKDVFDWNSGFASQDENIYDALLGDATRALYTIPLSGIFGSVVFLLLVNYIPRVTVLRLMFVLLAALFAIAGSSLIAVYETSHHSLTIAFYAFALCILNFGPNTILFMLPAELFPTK